MKFIVILLFCFLTSNMLMGQEEGDNTVYGLGEYNFKRAIIPRAHQYNKKTKEECRKSIQQGNTQRASTLHKEYLEDKTFLPSYEALASSHKGISLEDWQLHIFSEATFTELDQDKNGYVSKKELNKHKLMGSVEQHTQELNTAIREYNKDKFEKSELKDKMNQYKNDLRLLRKKGHVLKDEEFYLDSEKADDAYATNTKNSVTFMHGEVVVKKVPLGEYATTLNNQVEDENSMMPYIIGLAFIALLAVGTALIPKIM